MEKNSKYFRDLGWAQLQGRWAQPVVLTLVYLAISSLVSCVGTPILSLFVLPMGYSYVVSFLDDKRTGEGFKVEQLFDGYKDFLRIFGTAILQNIYIFLWTLLLVVPGIIKGISYSQTYFVLKDNPELSYNAAIERSMAMMEGHKMQYFLLMLSFIGWVILAILTFGLLTLWVNPYTYATCAHFYEYVKEEYEKRITA
ncbi:MAG: DUF975 family protein [Bacteroidaceae bacterium]|jgi:uncharacterized membrane protein|nr:DUF975 family protein [Bacteroidaceae bacterium]